MPFIQIVEYETDRADEIDAAMRSSMEQAGSEPGFTRLAHTQDRDNPRRYLTIVEFPSYEDAMANSEKPETGEMAAQLASLCTSGPRFHNLDVVLNVP
jgi:quinol monooxygenase YgiN